LIDTLCHVELETLTLSMKITERLDRVFKLQAKLTLLTAGVVFLSVSSLSFVTLWQYQTILREKTFEVCRNLSSNISNLAKEELLINEIFDDTRNAVSYVKESGISGLLNSYVISVDGRIVAHTEISMIGQHVLKPDLDYYGRISNLDLTDIKLGGGAVLRFSYPIFISYRGKMLRVGTGVFEFDRDEIYEPVDRVRNSILLTSLALFTGAIFLAFLLSRRLSRPVEKLADAAARISEGKLGVQVKPRSKDEIGQLTRVFNEMSLNLKEMEQMKINQAAISRELEIARGIQVAVLPANEEKGIYEFRGHMETADEVGGDYYDCLLLESKKKKYWWFIIGDVSGHGLRAGLTMLMAQTAIHTALEMKPELDPDDVMLAVNRVLYSNIRKLKEKKYMTGAFYRADNLGNVVFAGLHLDTFLIRGKTGTVETVPTDGMWMGIEENLDGKLKLKRLKLQPGDTMFLYTDGLTEAMDPEMNLYTENRLISILRGSHKTNLEVLEKRILADLADHRKGKDQMDDISFAMIRKKK